MSCVVSKSAPWAMTAPLTANFGSVVRLLALDSPVAAVSPAAGFPTSPRGPRDPLRPRAPASLRPATVRSRISSHSNSASGAKMPNTRRPAAVVVSSRVIAWWAGSGPGPGPGRVQIRERGGS